MGFFKQCGILMLVSFLYASLAYAAIFDISTETIEDRITIDEFAKFKINIKNNLDRSNEYRIYTPNFPTWDVRTEPIVNPITLELSPHAEGSVELIVDPLKIREIGTYIVTVNVRSRVSDQLVSVPLKVSVLSTQGLIGGYVPTVLTNVGIPEKIDPRQEIPIKIVLNNQNIIDYPRLIVRLESNLIADTINTSLGPKEEKTLEIKTSIDQFTKPQEDELFVSLYRDDLSIISPIVKKIRVISYADKELISEKKNLVMSVSTYDFTSNDPEYTGSFRVETTLLGSIFSSENPKASVVKENGKRYFVWNVELENNKMQVIVTRNFIPLFVVIALIVVMIAGYYALRAPLAIRKETSSLGKSEGGVTEISVVLRLQNRGNTRIKEIEVTEVLPSIVSVEREVSIGSLQPAKMLRHEKKGTTIVKWVIDNLDPSEERVLSYRIKSKLSILGSFSLPPATAVFKAKEKIMTTASNTLQING